MNARILHAPTSWAWLTAVAGCLLGGCPADETPMRFAPRQPPAEQIAQQRQLDRDRLGDWQPSGQAERTARVFMRANRMLAGVEQVPPAMAQQQLDSVRVAGKALLVDGGKKAVVRLGLYLLQRFESSLGKLCAAASGVEGAAAALLSGAEPPPSVKPAFDRFANHGGGFLVLAAANDLVRQGDGGELVLDPEDRFFARLAFKVYWSRVLPEVTATIDWLLSDFERRWYEIWVVERSKTASLQRKLKALHYLQQEVPDYRAHQARGLVLYQAGEYGRAVQAFEEAVKRHPNDDRIAAQLAQARRKAE